MYQRKKIESKINTQIAKKIQDPINKSQITKRTRKLLKMAIRWQSKYKHTADEKFENYRSDFKARVKQQISPHLLPYIQKTVFLNTYQR